MTEPVPTSTPPLSVLALDDDGDFRQYIRTVLEGEGHDVRAVATPEAFLEAAEARRPDIVLLDIKMGRHSGEEVLAEIRARWPRLCVIVVTGYPSLDSMRLTFKQDVLDYLAKPFSLAELRRVLAHAAERFDLGRRPQDRLRSDLGRQVRLARTERGWTLRDLSEASGVSVSQLSSIERGTHLPSLESLLLIGHALERKPSAWLEGAGF
ncbi:MAG: response regulator [Phycisphaerales bacterium]|nr:response regulator [Phycisphaerales bacterium]